MFVDVAFWRWRACRRVVHLAEWRAKENIKAVAVFDQIELLAFQLVSPRRVYSLLLVSFIVELKRKTRYNLGLKQLKLSQNLSGIIEMYTVFIDESGEAGIGNVRTETTGGASPYMTLGAALIHTDKQQKFKDLLATLTSEIEKKDLHCKKLSHIQLVHYARTLAAERIRFFGMISRKETLGEYKEEISEESSKYYNKCAQYLMERIGWFMEVYGIQDHQLDIVFEEAAAFDYEQMKNYLGTCKKNPLLPMTKKLQFIDVDRISTRKKKDEPLLQMADLVAHALYKCVNKQSSNYNIPEPRYLKELSGRFFSHPDDQKVVGAGLYCVHSTADINLDEDVKEILDSLTGAMPSRS